MVANLLLTITAIVLMACFVGFNLDNKCDISVIFHTFKSVPVFFTGIFSFVAGSLFSFSIMLLAKLKNFRKNKQKDTDEPTNA